MGRSICSDIIYEMEAERLIRVSGEVCIATQFGLEIHKKGGWLEYLKILQEKKDLERQVEEQKEKNRKAKEDVEIQKLVNDAKLSKWKVKTFWWLFAFATLGFSLSIYNFITNLSISENIKEERQSIQEKESELSKERISISTQKNLDSLTSSNSVTEK